MKLTPAILKNLYSAIYCMKPFNRWNMPLPEQINFVPNADKDAMGTYIYEDGEEFEHTITVSTEMCGHLSTVIRVLAHECIHMSRWANDRWSSHDKEFKRRAKVVSEELGFDPLEL